MESLNHPSLSLSLSSSAISAVLRCGTGAASPPRFLRLLHRAGGFRCTASPDWWPTKTPVGLDAWVRWFGNFSGIPRIGCLRAVFWGFTSPLFLRNPVGPCACCLLFLRPYFRDRSRTSVSDRGCFNGVHVHMASRDSILCRVLQGGLASFIFKKRNEDS